MQRTINPIGKEVAKRRKIYNITQVVNSEIFFRRQFMIDSYFSLVEIYKERVRDLLTETIPAKHLKVREHPCSGPYVDGNAKLIKF